MKRLDRYIAVTVALNIAIVLSVLCGLFLFFTFIEEANDIGKGDYGALDALQYVLLNAPKSIYELFPMAVLLGSLTGLGVLANRNELTVMRAAGVSVGRIVWAVMKVTGILLILVMVMEDRIAPPAVQYAKNMRSIKQAGHIAMQSGRGFWLRDGERFIHIRKLLPDGRLSNVAVYEFDREHRLQTMTLAQTMSYQAGRWLLQDLRQTRVYADHTEVRNIAEQEWKSTLSPGLLTILVLKPEDLSAPELYAYTAYLKANAQRAAPYELALWLKLVYPFTALVMLLLAVPFVFGSLRTVSIAQRVLAGAMLGIGFHVLNETVTHMGLLYNLPPVLSAALPTTLFLLAALVLMHRRMA